MLFKPLLVIVLSVSGVLSHGESEWGVTYTTGRICALKGSSVHISCTYSYPTDYTMQKTFWFIHWNKPQEPEDLSLNAEYSHRVEYLGDKNSDCTFRINQLKESDSAVYRFRFLTNSQHGKYTGQPGVSLTVTGLQVKVTENEAQSVTLTCCSTCTLSGSPTFTWNKNGKVVSNKNKKSINLASTDDTDLYSCATGRVTSPAVNVKCVKVEINSDTVSGGETVELTCRATCTHLTESNSFFWYKNEQRLTGGNRFSQSHRILTITARSKDTGRYSCAVKGNKNLVSPAVTLSVRCVKVEIKSSTVSEGVRVTLTCKITCTDLTGSQTFIWYKNGQYLSHTTQKYQNHDLQFTASSGDAGSYSCAVSGHENLPSPAVTLYPPKNTSVSVSPSGEIVEGSSVTLTCSSDANPPVQNYTWFKKNDTGVWQAGSGQSLNFSNFRYWNRGEYYCEAQNSLGAQNATALQVTVHGGQSLIVALVILGVVCVRRRKSTNETEGDRQGNKSPIDGNVSGMAMSHTRTQGTDRDDGEVPLYASVQPANTRNKDELLPSTDQKPLPQCEEGVQYASIQIRPSSAAPRSPAPSIKEDCVLYSTLRKLDK